MLTALVAVTINRLHDLRQLGFEAYGRNLVKVNEVLVHWSGEWVGWTAEFGVAVFDAHDVLVPQHLPDLGGVDRRELMPGLVVIPGKPVDRARLASNPKGRGNQIADMVPVHDECAQLQPST